MNLRKIINLSPLVDVLMIVIFWYIMMSNQTLEENKANAQSEMEQMQLAYEHEIGLLTQEKDAVALEKARAEEELARLQEEKELLLGESESYRDVIDDLSDQLGNLREENETLGAMLEQSVGYVYIHLYDGLNKNRIVEVNYESELVDKFIFSNGESEYLTQKLTKIIGEYATRDEKERIAVIFIYEGSNAFYVDITRIMNVLYELRDKYGTSVHTINMAE
jgi:biopolymer transport protein ExbD